MEAIRPFNARSLVLSVLLGLDPPGAPGAARSSSWPSCSASPPARCARRCRGWSAAGELAGDGDGYRLVGRLLERKAAQDIGRRPAPRAWDGTWTVAVVTAPRRVVAARRAFRTHMANLRMGELRPGHVAAAGEPRPARRRRRAGRRARTARRRGPATTLAGPAVAAARRSRRRPPTLTGRLDAMLPALADRRADALPPTITLAAEVVRFLRAEPLLPPALTPQPWPPDALRDRYREFDRALGRTLRHAVRA